MDLLFFQGGFANSCFRASLAAGLAAAYQEPVILANRRGESFFVTNCEKGKERLSVHVPEMADDESHSYWASPTFLFSIFYNNEEGGALRSKIEISALGENENRPKKLIDPFERQSEERLHRILMSSLSIQPFRPFDHTKRKPQLWNRDWPWISEQPHLKLVDTLSHHVELPSRPSYAMDGHTSPSMAWRDSPLTVPEVILLGDP